MRDLTARPPHIRAPLAFICRHLLWALAVLGIPASTSAQDQQALFELFVNGVRQGEALIVMRGDDVLVSTSVLSAGGLRNFAGAREPVAGEEFVSLASLAPSVIYALDERELRLRIDAAAELLREQVRDLGTRAPRDITYRRDRSAFLNYAVGWSGGGQYDAVAESGATVRGALVQNTLTLTAQGFTRGLTNATIDDRSRLRRWTIGDAFAQNESLGGSVFLAGVSVATEFGVDPYFVRHPSLSLATPVTTPSVVEVYVNDRLVSQEQVGPGQLDLQNLPMTRGRNDARVVVRDAFGATREFSTDYYLSTSSLAKGLHSYQYSLGFVRDAVANESWGYTTPAFLGRHRVGLTDTITAGGRLEATEGLASGGPSLNLRLPVGELEAAAGFSGSDAGLGTASSLGYVYSGWPLSGGVSINRLTGEYAVVSSGRDDLRPLRQLNAFVSLPVAPRVTATLQHSSESLRDGTRFARTGLLASARLNAHLDLTATVARVRSDEAPRYEAFAGVTIPFGQTVTTTALVRDGAGTRTAVDVMRSLPVGSGYGYQVRAEGGSRNLVSAVGQLQNRYGRYEVRREVYDGAEGVRLQAAGALVAIGGGLFATRPVRNSYALVQVPGVEGVRGFVSNQEVGQTDADGNLLVPELEPYYGNLLRIADEDIPLDYTVRGTRMALAPPYRGGAVARFPVVATRRIAGTLVVSAGGLDRVPRSGLVTVTVDGVEHVSPIGARGEFYFEDLPGGTFPAVIEDEHGSCRVTISVQPADGPVTDLGLVRCTAAGAP